MTKTEAQLGVIVRDNNYRPWIIIGLDRQPRQTYLQLKALGGTEKRRAMASTVFPCPGACPDCGKAVEQFEDVQWCGACGWSNQHKPGQVVIEVAA